MSQVIIDVREQDEFDAEHIAGSIHLPLSKFNEVAPGALEKILGSGAKESVLIMCRGGNRARIAQKQIEQMGFKEQLRTQVFEGGILEWKRAGRPVVGVQNAPLPIMRQVQLVVGPGVLIFALLSLYLRPEFAWGAVFFGAGLTVAGLTGFCGMAELLCRMPWNRKSS